jgi:GrpB-like predicted nucleotidyltransferase (UPF0157 family)
MISIETYSDSWPDEFRVFANGLREILGDLALRIDHIGSTSVPGLAAKDVIDVQVTVGELSDSIISVLTDAGYIHCDWIFGDHIPPGGDPDESRWSKRVFKEIEGMRRVNFHLRPAGQPNQRYPILFRDYLRAHPAATEAYAQVKVALARLHPEDMDAYYDVKDPVCDIIMEGAEAWVKKTNWEQGPSDC